MLYSSNQHAREWITSESNRRLVHLFVDNYTNPTDATPAASTSGDVKGEADDLTKGDLTKIVNANELWFVVVANPDGYDFTFTEGNRLWRKNLRDNNKDGEITQLDGVDPNRNYPTKWGYDNEGSSDDPASETFRGTAPKSEPETQAMDGLMKRVGFEFQINYHSAAELLLYPIGWQQTTYTADDPIYRALSGTDDDPAIKGQDGLPDFYDPDVAAELYITNGETTDHAHAKYGTLAWTPEMDVSDPERGGGSSEFISRTPTRTSRRRSRRTSRSRSTSPARPRTRRTRSPTSATRRPTSRSRRSSCPTAARRTCRSTPSASSATSRCTTRSTPGASARRPRRSGTAARSTAPTATSTTTASAAP